MKRPRMPTLCGLAGPLPEIYRPFIDERGDLRVGDAGGLEAQWILGEIDPRILDPHRNYEVEDDYVPEECRAAREALADCVLCGDEDVDTVDLVCLGCIGVPSAQRLVPAEDAALAQGARG